MFGEVVKLDDRKILAYESIDELGREYLLNRYPLWRDTGHPGLGWTYYVGSTWGDLGYIPLVGERHIPTNVDTYIRAIWQMYFGTAVFSQCMDPVVCDIVFGLEQLRDGSYSATLFLPKPLAFRFGGDEPYSNDVGVDFGLRPFLVEEYDELESRSERIFSGVGLSVLEAMLRLYSEAVLYFIASRIPSLGELDGVNEVYEDGDGFIVDIKMDPAEPWSGCMPRTFQNDLMKFFITDLANRDRHGLMKECYYGKIRCMEGECKIYTHYGVKKPLPNILGFSKVASGGLAYNPVPLSSVIGESFEEDIDLLELSDVEVEYE